MNQKITTKAKIKEINQRLKLAKNYSQWKTIALQYDQLPLIQEQINKVYSQYYDYNYIQEFIKCLRQAREKDQIEKLIAILRSHSYRNIGNFNCPLLYRDSYVTSKKLIQQLQEEISNCFSVVLNSGIYNNKKLQFFGQMRHAIGRSALLLSGGAILGMYHIGVVQTLIQAGCMPKIIAGSSAGSIIAALLATRPIQDFFDGKKFNFTAFANKKRYSLWRKIKRFGKQGYLMDIRVLKQFLRDNIGDITFQQAFDKYGWILNITVTGTTKHDQDRLLNYLTAPNVLIWSASAASSAIPYVYGATDLYCKNHEGKLQKYTLMNRQFLDGSLGHDLPMNKLSIFFNVNNFIVSQTNPWVIPFMDYTQEFKMIQNPVLINFLLFCHRIKQFLLSQIKHRAFQLSYVFPSAITKFLNLFTQSYVGNITIWPVPSLSNYLRIMQNPTSFQMIMNFVEDGRSRTFTKINEIKASLFMQKQIENCYKRIKKISFFINDKKLQDPDEQQAYSRSKIDSIKQIGQDFIKDDIFYNNNKISQQVVQQKNKKKRTNQKNNRNISIYKQMKSNMARNASFLIPRINSKDSQDFKKVKSIIMKQSQR